MKQFKALQGFILNGLPSNGFQTLATKQLSSKKAWSIEWMTESKQNWHLNAFCKVLRTFKLNIFIQKLFVVFVAEIIEIGELAPGILWDYPVATR